MLSHEQEGYYTIRKASVRFKMGHSTLYRYIRAGWLVPVQRGGRRFVTEAQVELARQLAADAKSEKISAGVRRTMNREQRALTEALSAAQARIAELEAFVAKVADGKRLARRSWMTMNNNCTACGGEARACVDGEDDLAHREWCVVLAARRLLPGFAPERYPDDVRTIRRCGNMDDEQWRW